MNTIIMQGPKSSAIEQRDMPQITEDQVLIRLKYVGVCRSEHDDWLVAQKGQTFGHEPMGIIAQVGSRVTEFSVGDRVSGLWGGAPNIGGMAQYQVAHPKKDTIIKLPKQVCSEDAILEPLACLISAVSKVRPILPGKKICVVGCGYMGCGAIGLLCLKGYQVVAVDIRSSCLEDAKKYGAAECYTPEQALKQYGQDGFEVVMEWGETNDSLNTAINLTKICGQLCIGAYHTGGKRLIDMQQLNFKAIECLSTHPREAQLLRECAYQAVELLASHRWNFQKIPTMIYPMNQFDLAHQQLETKYGHHMKALIAMEMVDGEPYLING